MNLSSLKTKSTPELSAMAQDLGVGGAENMRRHSLMVAIMEEENGREKSLRGDGVIEVLSDGFGFLRTADTQYLPGTDDIYVSPSQSDASDSTPEIRLLVWCAHPRTPRGTSPCFE